MRKSFLKTILLFVLLANFLSVNAQKISTIDTKLSTPNHVYYIDVRQVNTKTICLNLENTISKKEGVISFKTVGFPSKYFVLKSELVIKQADLKLWLQENGVEMVFFGEGKASLEDLWYKKIKNN